MKYHGQCLCGAVRYEFDTLSARMGHCHCSMCRKFHGAAFATLGEVPLQDFHWCGDMQALKSYTADNGTVRRFCRHCGSSMSFETPSGPGTIEIALATLDSEIPHRPDAHIFTEFKANWYAIEDQLPQFKRDRNSQRRK